jgi:hypothetical protein
LSSVSGDKETIVNYTPRTNSYIEQFPDCRREPRLLDFCRRLETELAEARAEIERLKGF